MTEEQKQKARDNYKRYYQKNKERILKYQKEYRKKKYETDEEYRDKVKKRWEYFKKSFNEQHPDYHKEYNKQWGKNKRNSYKTRCEKAIEYIEELISDTNGLITAYRYEDKEETIKRYIEDLKTDIKHYEYLKDILRGEDNEI